MAMFKKLFLVLAFILPLSPVFASDITWEVQGGGDGSGTSVYPATSTAFFPSGLEMSGIAPSASTGLLELNSSGVISTATAFSEYYEYYGFGSPYRVNGTTVTFEVSYASHPAYGKA